MYKGKPKSQKDFEAPAKAPSSKTPTAKAPIKAGRPRPKKGLDRLLNL